MFFEFGKFQVDIDVEATKEFYSKHGKTVLEDCGCGSCQNYYQAIAEASDPIKRFFDSIGVDPQKSPEATWWYTNENGVAYYSLTFHVVGTIINAVDTWRTLEDNRSEQMIEHFYEIDKGFKIGFTSKDIILLEKDFPTPCIQLEIDAYLPWVLD